jgi:hypothetical protein
MAGPSNIRRRNQGQEEKDTYLEEDFMKRNRNAVFRSDDEADEDERPQPRLPRNAPPIPEDNGTGDILWDEYRIKPNTKLEDKIEMLVVNFGKTSDEVAQILELSLTEADRHVAELEARLRDIGRPLDGEDKELQRGIAIRKLQIYIQDLGKERAVNTDPRLLTAQLAAQRELNALMELATDKKRDKDGTEVVDVFDAAISKLGPDAAVSLHTFLRDRYSSALPSS